MLSPEHIDDLRKSGLEDDAIGSLQYQSVVPSSLSKLGPKFEEVTSAYAIPYFGLDGKKTNFERLKIFPSIKDKEGHTIKYFQAPGSSPEIYLPPLIDWEEVAREYGKDLYVTEGEKKAAAGCQAGLPVIGLGGVWNFCQKINGGERLLIPTFDLFVWKGRQVLIIPDSDGWRKDKQLKVLSGLYVSANELVQRGATVRFLKLSDNGGQKVGLDDWFVQEKGNWKYAWDHLERVPLDDQRLRKIASWYQKWEKKQREGASSGHANGEGLKSRCPTIFIPADLAFLSAAAWNSITISNNPPRLFSQGNQLIRLDTERNGTVGITFLTSDHLRYELARRAKWEKITEKTSEGCSPPLDVVRDLLVTPNPPVPYLHRLAKVPTISACGRLIDQPGYDAETGIFYDPPKIAIPPIPEVPNQADVHLAKETILLALHDFPFAGESDRVHALGLFLLPFVRDLIQGPTPLHLIEAPIPGAGKGLLADTLLMISVGKHIGVITEARNDEEWRKRLTSCFREAYPVILLDNISKPVDSGTLAGALTALTWSDRLLGKNETLSVPVRSIWVMTANNPTLSTEIARRTIRIRLDPNVDRPWMREGFICADLRSWVMEYRGDLIWAALVLVRSWLAAGRPKSPAKPLGSFEAWSGVIGGILEHVGFPGFLGNLSQFYEATDTDGAVWRRFIAEWWSQFGNREVGTADLFPLAEQIDGLNLGRNQSDRAMKTVLGKQLAKHRERVSGDFRLVQAGNVKRASMWKLEFMGTGEPPEVVPSSAVAQEF